MSGGIVSSYQPRPFSKLLKDAYAMNPEACCTCARFLHTVPPQYDEKTFKVPRQLECCGRNICAECLNRNTRFQDYCPFCQLATAPSALPAQGLRDPPAYATLSCSTLDDELPSYNDNGYAATKKSSSGEEDILHFLDPTKDTISSLSLAYSVPPEVLRRKNHLFDNKLLLARKTMLIPGEYYKGGVSLSPRPIESKEEGIRKSKIRRWMVTTKNADYNMALLYLKQSQYDLDAAVLAYVEDEKWEKEHPLSGKTRSRRRVGVQF